MARPEGYSRYGFAVRLRPCGLAAADFAPKNSPPDCFLYGAHPLRVRIPRAEKESTTYR